MASAHALAYLMFTAHAQKVNCYVTRYLFDFLHCILKPFYCTLNIPIRVHCAYEFCIAFYCARVKSAENSFIKQKIFQECRCCCIVNHI